MVIDPLFQRYLSGNLAIKPFALDYLLVANFKFAWFHDRLRNCSVVAVKVSTVFTQPSATKPKYPKLSLLLQLTRVRILASNTRMRRHPQHGSLRSNWASLTNGAKALATSNGNLNLRLMIWEL